MDSRNPMREPMTLPAKPHLARLRVILCVLLCSSLAIAMLAAPAPAQANAGLHCENKAIKLDFSAAQPGLSSLSIDSLERGEFRPSPIVDPGAPPPAYNVTEQGGWTRYALATDPGHPTWEMRCEGNTLRVRTHFSPEAPPRDLTLRFNPDIDHATLLGHVTPTGDVTLPALLHLPGMGSLRITAAGAAKSALHYDARRSGTPFVAVAFPAATADHKSIEYTLQTAAIYPAIPGIENDPRFDGFRRDFLDIFQQNAELHVLANHAASDACAFTVYEYADVARYTPELAPGLTALDLVRETLDRYLAGFLGYGMVGYKGFDTPEPGDDQEPYTFTDVYPSLLISAYDYADGAHDERWLRANYKGLRKWAESVAADNPDGSPFLEYPASGNSGSWTKKITVRPANWWDTIGFGHQDAYSNALAFRALRGMAALAERIGESQDAGKYRRRADSIRAAFVPTFLNPSTGVLAGWKSSDGALHDYWFPFVNGIAVRYGLVEGDQAHKIMNRIVAKIDTVGYRNFSLGLPGNLVPIRRADYVDLDPRFGGPMKEDGSDGFEKYENGGATACFAYFTIAALYRIGEKEQGDKILLPMLHAFAQQGFSGRAANGLTYDWKDWRGGAHGYEGFLVDNYYALLAVLDRAGMMAKMP